MRRVRGITRRFAAIGGLLAVSLAGGADAPRRIEVDAARKLVRAVEGWRGRLDRLHTAGAHESAGAGDLLAELMGPRAVETIKLTSRVKLRALMAARVRADFASGQTCVVDGWVLSRTEQQLARVAALVAKVGLS